MKWEKLALSERRGYFGSLLELVLICLKQLYNIIRDLYNRLRVAFGFAHS